MEKVQHRRLTSSQTCQEVTDDCEERAEGPDRGEESGETQEGVPTCNGPSPDQLWLSLPLAGNQLVRQVVEVAMRDNTHCVWPSCYPTDEVENGPTGTPQSGSQHSFPLSGCEETPGLPQ